MKDNEQIILDIHRWDGTRYRITKHDFGERAKVFYPDANGQMGLPDDIRLKGYKVDSIGIYPSIKTVTIFISPKEQTKA